MIGSWSRRQLTRPQRGSIRPAVLIDPAERLVHSAAGRRQGSPRRGAPNAHTSRLVAPAAAPLLPGAAPDFHTDPLPDSSPSPPSAHLALHLLVARAAPRPLVRLRLHPTHPTPPAQPSRSAPALTEPNPPDPPARAAQRRQAGGCARKAPGNCSATRKRRRARLRHRHPYPTPKRHEPAPAQPPPPTPTQWTAIL